VATGKSRVGLDRVLRNTGIGEFFTVTRCADETFGKPHPGMLYEIMDVVGVEKSSVIMVGDTSHDLQMAANAGVHGLGVSYGAHPEKALRQQPHQALMHDVLSVNQWLSTKTRPWAPMEI
jgi:phosphoglycolate phosphatase